MTPGFRVNTAHVVSEVFDDGEAAIIDLRSGTYFSLNSTGALLWPTITRGTTLDDLVELALTGTDGGPGIETKIEEFVMSLVAEGIVEPVDDVDPLEPAASETEPLAYVPPEIRRFDELQELLLLDPIHDVSAQGWPHTPPE